MRVQLSETAAWERGAAGSAVRIDLLDEPKAPEDAVMEGIEQLNLSDTANARQEKSTADLALERGDKGFAAKNGLVDVKIQEKEVSKPAEPPSFDEHDLTDRLDTLHLNLEGHTTTFGSDRQRRRNRQSGDGDVDTEDGMDWQL